VIETFLTYGRAYFWHDGIQWSGLAVTLMLLAISLVLGLCVSLPLAIARVSSRRALCWPVQVFTFVFRGTPLYVQLLIIYTGMYQLEIIRETPFVAGFFRSGFNCVVLALVLNTSAYTTEFLAGAFRAIPAGEVEAARAYGLGRMAIWTKLLIPAALRRALPSYSNEVIFMLHATAIAFTATVPDLMKVAGDVNAETYMPFEAYGIAAMIYLGTAMLLLGLFRQIERHFLAYASPRKA